MSGRLVFLTAFRRISPHAGAGANALVRSPSTVLPPLPNSGSLTRRRGGVRGGQRAPLLPGVLSGGMWIKQRTSGSEQLLTRWAGPLTLWSGLLRQRRGEAWREPPAGAGGPASPHPREAASESGLLDRAWRLLLENQPHDSICGCSVDQTHDEMRPRYDQCDQIGEDLTHQAMRRIGAQGQPERVYVFNPLPGPRSDFVIATVPIERGRTPVALLDDNGRRYPCQPVAGSGAPQGDRTDVGFVAGDVPGFGYTTYAVEYGEAAVVAHGQPYIENEYFRVEANAEDGTLTVEDKRSGARYEGLNRLTDGGDRGDEYNYCAPEPDVVVGAPASAEARVIESGPARQTLEISMAYRLPARLGLWRADKPRPRPAADRRRSGRTVSCPVRVLASLSPGVPRIDIRTEFENRAEDHRLRAEFPSGVTTDHSCAEQHFGVVERPLALPSSDETWMEQPVGTHPQKTFVDVNDGVIGLLIANHGLPEYEVLETPVCAVIALTLLRCVGWLSRADLSSRKGPAGPSLATPAAQCPGAHAFEYAIIPHTGGWQQAYAAAHRFAAPMRARWNRDGTGLLPGRDSLIELDGEGLVVTALKRPEDRDRAGTILRLYNTLDGPVGGRIRLSTPWRSASVVDMKEDLLGPAQVDGGWVRLELRRNEIVTLRFDSEAPQAPA